MRTNILLLSALAGGIAVSACIPSIPADTQSAGNAPLNVDLDDAGTPFVVMPGDTAQEVTVSVRGPNKGAGERGGITGSFTGNGGSYCVIMDPANVWEVPGTSQETPTSSLDDGDSDLYVGRAADYTGSLGTRIGDFVADYVDALGVPHEIDENLCVQGDLNGNPGGHSGKGSVEFCQIETQPNTPYVVKAETISVPVTGGVLKVAMRVSSGPCVNTTLNPIDENKLTGDN